MPSLLDTNQDDQIQIDEDKNYFEELVGEGKKYKDPEALAKKSLHADRTIAERERELKELREDFLRQREALQSGMSQKDFLDQLKTVVQSTSRDQTNNTNDDTKVPQLDPNQLKSLISSTVKELTVADKQEKNWSEVKTKLTETYGNNYAPVLQKKLDELGLSVEQADALARTAPKAFLNALGTSARTADPFDAPFKSEQRPAFAPNASLRDRKFYSDLRDKQPSVYYDPKTQNQMIKDAEAMGTEKFTARGFD